ncbi:ABC transporter substrate-binding protein [Pseudomonas sp. LRF_L74]|uniref:ABC transporter substrate-binding protein n=1 Tax=Pseudomonas sp. LRF_L74 TaxID=3369422 RepID=UPI003F60F70A
MSQSRKSSGRTWATRLLLLLTLSGLGHAVQADEQERPDTIRIGAPALSGDTQGVWGAMGVARAKGWFEDEFAKDGISVEFPGFKGGGPMVGQALANGQIDFAGNGDMISLIGRASGIKSRLILPTGKMENAYLLVRPDSNIRSVQDLRGKKVAYFKGNYIQLQVIRILASEGLSERDIRNVSLRGAAAASALLNGKIDAIFGGSDSLEGVTRGILREVYSTQGKSLAQTAQSGLLVREDFAERHPELTQRVVNVLVRAADWASEPGNRDEVLAIWAKGGKSVAALEHNYSDRPLADRLSPLLDPFYVGRYADTQRLVGELGLLRGQPEPVEQWFDRHYLDAALKQFGLEDRWAPLDTNGEKVVQ